MFLIKKTKAQTMWIITDCGLWCWSFWNKTTAYTVVIICCCKQRLHCKHQRFLLTHFFPIFTPNYEFSQPNCGTLKQNHVSFEVNTVKPQWDWRVFMMSFLSAFSSFSPCKYFRNSIGPQEYPFWCSFSFGRLGGSTYLLSENLLLLNMCSNIQQLPFHYDFF